MTKSSISLNRWLALGLLAILLFAAAASLKADDRDLVREAGREPYLYVIFDVSGSMNWTPPNDDPSRGPVLARDSFAPAYGDDPTSKFYQAKSALYRVLTDPELEGAVNWGFGTYNQDRVRVYRKHWLYTPTEATTPIAHPLIGCGHTGVAEDGEAQQLARVLEIGDQALGSTTAAQSVPVDLAMGVVQVAGGVGVPVVHA
ncbi:MAG: hypothetical protein WBP34_03535, partial [Thermoanaerobaculia bacterium]